MRTRAIWILGLLATICPSIANACAVCFGGEYDNRQAFIDTTVILTVVPLLLIGFFVWLLVRRIARLESSRQEALKADQEARIRSDQASAEPS